MPNPRLVTLLCAVCLLATTAAVPPVAVARSFDDGDLVVTLRDGRSIDEVNARYGTRTMGVIQGANVFKIHTDDVAGTLKRLKRDRIVRGAMRDAKVRRHQTHTFPFEDAAPVGPLGPDLFAEQFGEQGRLGELGVEAAKTLADGGRPVLVAVLDTGLDPSHPAVASQVWTNAAEAEGTPGVDDDRDGYVDDVAGYDFVDDDADPNERGVSGPVAGHGTFISGLIVASAPRARILPVRVMNGEGVGSAFDAAAGITYAVRKGARVLNLSFGTDGGVVPPILETAIRSASRLGVTVVVAAGNDATSDLPYPASDTRNVITVGATDGDHVAEFSNFGTPQRQVAVWAPGTELVGPMAGSTVDGRPRYARWSGTSFAAAFMSAACAELLSVRSSGSPSMLRAFVVSSGVSLTSARGTRIRFADAVLASMYDTRKFDVQTRVVFDNATGYWAEGGVLRRMSVGGRLVEAAGVSAYNLQARVRYTLHARASAADGWVAIGSGTSDALGSLSMKVCKAARPGMVAPLGIDVRTVRALELRDETGAVVRRATVDPDAAPVQAEALLERLIGASASPSFVRYWHDAGALRLMIDVRGLDAGEFAYDLVVDGTTVARVATCGETASSIVALFTTTDSGSGDSGLPPWSESGGPRRVELYRMSGREGRSLAFAGDFDTVTGLVVGDTPQPNER